MTTQVAVQIPGSSVSGTSNVNNTTNYANTTEVSNIINFTIYPPAGPAPTIISVSAPPNSMASIPYCGPNGFTLTVTGSNFVSGSIVNWSSAANPSASGPVRATSFVSSNQLTAAILPSDVAFPGTAAVSVSTPSATSMASQFTMTTPATSLPLPNIASTSQNATVNGVPVGTPTSVPAGTPMFTLTLNGSSLLPCSTVSFGGDVMPTTYISPTQLTAPIPASEVATAGAGGTARNVNVTVSTIGPGGGTSAPILFTITP
jgi:hypothetical protein